MIYIVGTRFLPVGRNIDAESWARLLVRARGARDIMYRMRCTWETLANVVERRSGATAEHSDRPVMVFSHPWGCCNTTQNRRGRSTQIGAFVPVHALISKQNCRINILRTLNPAKQPQT